MKFCKFLPLQWLGLEEELHKDLALLQEPRTGRPRDRDSAGAGPPVLATLSPCRGRRLGPCWRGGWASPLDDRAGSRERRRSCSDSLEEVGEVRGSWGLQGCKRALGLVEMSRCSGQGPCKVEAVHSLPPSYFHC